MSERVLLAFGFYDRESPHVHTVLDAYRKEGWSIREAHTTATSAAGKIFDLLRLWPKTSGGADAVLVPFPGHHLMPLAWLLTRFPRRRLIFEAFISLYDTAVHDRGLVKEGSLRARWLRFVDRLCCALSDEVIIDTQAHKRYFVSVLGVPEQKMRVIYLEARRDLIPRRTAARNPGIFTVFFYGTYIPLQGIDHIIDAAKILEDRDPSIRFTFVGGGQTADAMLGKIEELGIRNIALLPFQPLPELMKQLADADLALGIFGTTDKAARVIPHKVIDAVAAGVPVITRDSPAIRERYADHPGVQLCPAGDPKALAEMILAERARSRETR